MFDLSFSFPDYISKKTSLDLIKRGSGNNPQRIKCSHFLLCHSRALSHLIYTNSTAKRFIRKMTVSSISSFYKIIFSRWNHRPLRRIQQKKRQHQQNVQTKIIVSVALLKPLRKKNVIHFLFSFCNFRKSCRLRLFCEHWLAKTIFRCPRNLK